MNKIKEEDLKLIKEHHTNASTLSHDIGAYEHQKYVLILELNKINKEISEFKQVLEAEYGSININLEDGSYTEIEKDVEDKKD